LFFADPVRDLLFQTIGLYTETPFQTADREEAESKMGDDKAGLDL
jgi:hypothetical protein